MIWLLFSQMLWAQNLHQFTLNFSESLPASRELYTAKPQIKGTDISSNLLRIEYFRRNNQFKNCADLAKKIRPKAKGLEVWLLTKELHCREAQLKTNKEGLARVEEILSEMDRNPSWALFNPAAESLQEEFLNASFTALSFEMKSKRMAAWKNIEKLSERLDWMSRDQRADFYQYQGEILLIQQDLSGAKFSFEKSLEQKERSALRDRLSKISKTKNIENKNKTSGTMSISDAESAVYNRFRNAVKSKDYLSAVEDGTQLIMQFSGGKNADEAANQILEIYLAVAGSSDSKLRLARTKILEQMRKADGDRLLKWAKYMVSREYFEDAVLVSQYCLEKVGGQALSAQVINMVAESSYHTGDFKLANEFYKKLEREYAGSDLGKAAVYRLGILHFRMEEYSDSSAYFEKYLVFSENGDSDLSALYWLWRARQKLKIEKADAVAQILIKKYPLSYYALRASAELNNGKLSFASAKNSQKWQAQLWLTQEQQLGWDRFKLLISGGWYSEAQVELSQLPAPTTSEGKIVWAKTWASSFEYYEALKMLIEVWQSEEGHREKEIISLVYPKEFSDFIESSAKKYKLSSALIFSLIRQESSFRVDVVSPAGARGLMQVLRATGEEIAKDLRIKNYDRDESLFEPWINISIGTNYMYRLNRNFSGNVPLAIAAYNAGIGNIRSWLANRKDLSGLISDRGQGPESDLWIEELPWPETQGYVKNVLRNWMVYRLLDESEVKFSFPIWAAEGL